MSIHFSSHYPVSPQVLFTAFTQQTFFEQRYAETEVDEYTIQRFCETPDGFDIAIEINPPIHVPKGVPSAAKRLIPKRQKILYTAVWRNEAEATWSALYCYDVQGKPIKILGQRQIRAAVQGCSNEVSFKVETSLPLFGKVLADIVESRVERELAADEKALEEYIKNHT
mgnify:CR=1 FL=1